MTGPRIEGLTAIGQMLRFSTRHARMDQSSASFLWLRHTKTNLANCATIVTLTGPSTLSFARNSTIGFSGLELHFLADWLESPQFPDSFHTLLAPPDIFWRNKENTTKKP